MQEMSERWLVGAGVIRRENECTWRMSGWDGRSPVVWGDHTGVLIFDWEGKQVHLLAPPTNEDRWNRDYTHWTQPIESVVRFVPQEPERVRVVTTLNRVRYSLHVRMQDPRFIDHLPALAAAFPEAQAFIREAAAQSPPIVAPTR